MAPLPLRPAVLFVIANPPQSPGVGLHELTSTEGHETAAASDTSTGNAGAPGSSLRLVKIALWLVEEPPGVAAPLALMRPPLMMIGPPSDLTTSPAPAVR